MVLWKKKLDDVGFYVQNENISNSDKCEILA